MLTFKRGFHLDFKASRERFLANLPPGTGFRRIDLAPVHEALCFQRIEAKHELELSCAINGLRARKRERIIQAAPSYLQIFSHPFISGRGLIYTPSGRSRYSSYLRLSLAVTEGGSLTSSRWACLTKTRNKDGSQCHAACQPVDMHCASCSEYTSPLAIECDRFFMGLPSGCWLAAYLASAYQHNHERKRVRERGRERAEVWFIDG